MHRSYCYEPYPNLSDWPGNEDAKNPAHYSQANDQKYEDNT